MVCTGCGSEANASCNCGVAYVPKSVQAREKILADPRRSDGDIADELGISRQAVSKVRKQVATELPPEESQERIGRDGKSYPVKPRRGADDSEPTDDEHAEGLRVIAARGFLNRAIEAKNICTIEKLQASDITEAMIEAAYDAAAAWSEAAQNLRGMISHG